MMRVLFVCIHNSARSQMAEAYLNKLGGDRFEALSAGLEPGRLNPFVVRAMSEDGIDISWNKTKSVDGFLSDSFDYVIAVCDKEAAERCPVLPMKGEKLHWEFPDPSAKNLTDEEKMSVARSVRDDIKKRIEDWIKTV